jgi:hypothetical protein
MEPDKRQNDDSFPGSMEMAGPSPDCTAYRAQTELVEALARLVLDSVAKTEQLPGNTREKTNGHQRPSRMGPRRVD